ncbi:hypothetical protein [Hyphococcus sp. DH-69]|uniref:hypothetical protein n=1 Tax=Hyphococcus formosus TaxID=3143534 RepID=UPI00398A7454
MRLVIGLAQSETQNEIAFRFTSASGNAPISVHDLAPGGLPTEGRSLDTKLVVNAQERFEKYGDDAISVLGGQCWPLFDTLLDDSNVRGLILFESALFFVARAIDRGDRPVEAITAWSELSAPALDVFRHHRSKSVLIDIDCAHRDADHFKFASKDYFDIDADIAPSRELTPPNALSLLLAEKLISESSTVAEMAAEFDVSALRFPSKSTPIGNAAYFEFNKFRGRLNELQQSLDASNGEIEKLAHKAEENNLLRSQLFAVQTELEKKYKSTVLSGSDANKIKKLNKEIALLKNDIAKIRSSTSWRLTAPVRWVRKSIGGSNKITETLRTKRQAALIRRSPLFDQAWYISKYDDVAKMRADAAEHYVRHGFSEGRSPGPKFDGAAYLRANPDIAATGQNPLLHYLRHGKAEGRPLKPATGKSR